MPPAAPAAAPPPPPPPLAGPPPRPPSMAAPPPAARPPRGPQPPPRSPAPSRAPQGPHSTALPPPVRPLPARRPPGHTSRRGPSPTPPTGPASHVAFAMRGLTPASCPLLLLPPRPFSPHERTAPALHHCLAVARDLDAAYCTMHRRTPGHRQRLWTRFNISRPTWTATGSILVYVVDRKTRSCLLHRLNSTRVPDAPRAQVPLTPDDAQAQTRLL